MKTEKIVVSKTAHSQRLKSFRTSAALMLTTLMLVVAATTGATAQTFTTFDAPGAGTGAYEGTFGGGINTAGAIAGEYLDANNVFHGFVRAANGTITTFNVKKAGTGTYQGTVGGAISTS